MGTVTSTIAVTYTGRFVAHDESRLPVLDQRTRMREATDRVLDELERLDIANEAVWDFDVSANLGTGMMSIAVTLSGHKRPDEAIMEGLSVIRSAIHAAGIETPEWPGTHTAGVPLGQIEYIGSEHERHLVDA